MNLTNFHFKQMHQTEVDAEMAALFQEQNEEATAKRASVCSNGHRPPQLENTSTVHLSPEMNRVREKMLSVMSASRLPVHTAPGNSHGEKKLSEPSKMFIETAKDTTSTLFPLKVMEMPIPAVITFDIKMPAVIKLAEHRIFPVKDVLTVKKFTDPLSKMTELCRQLRTHSDYERVREDYCNLSICLNLIGKMAPAYRPLLKAGAAWGNTIHKVIHRDQVVIDLHWGHATKMQLMPLDQDHVALFGDDENFQFDLAWTLAGKQWRKEYRAVEALCLTTLQQCQMLTLRGTEVTARLKSISAGWRESGGKSASNIAMVKRLISQWAEQDKRIWSQRDFYEKLWLAREILGREASAQQIAQLHALMMGSDIQDRTTIRDKLKSLDKRVLVAKVVKSSS